MSCTTCKKIIDLSAPEMDFDYTTRTKSILGRDGATYKITSSLVAVGHRPRGGWGVTVRINGQTHTVNADSPREAFTSVQRLAETNALRISVLNLWFNLNLQWLQRSVEKYQTVRFADLLAVAIASDEAQTGTNEIPKWSPTSWLGGVWGTLGTYLAGNSYDYSVFVSLLDVVETMLDTVQSPATGNAAFYQKFTLRLFALKNDPVFTQYAARVWLHTTINEVTGTTITYDELSQLNHWKL